MTATRDGRLVTRYLLGELPEGQEERFESEYFSSAGAFDELLAAEDELIDAYVAGRLPPEERARFENHFLSSPERLERVEFARTLRATAAQRPLAPEPASLSATAAAAPPPPA